MKDTLLDLDHIPTMEELRAYFRKHDFSTTRYYEPDQLCDIQKEDINKAKIFFKEQWDKLAPRKGLKSGPANYGANNPLMQLRENMAQTVSEGVCKLTHEHPEQADLIINEFQEEYEDIEKANKLLHRSIDTLMDVADYETLAAVIQDAPAEEDFSAIPNNHRAQDFNRKWNHTRAKINVQSLEEVPADVPDQSNPVEDQAINNLKLNQFWSSLSDEDRELLLYSMEGMTRQQIADKLGYKTHSAVTKRLAKIKAKFNQV